MCEIATKIKALMDDPLWHMVRKTFLVRKSALVMFTVGGDEAGLADPRRYLSHGDHFWTLP
jgi:hypothetical protein